MNIKYLDFNIVYEDDSFTSIHSLDKLFEVLYDDDEEFNQLIKKYFARIDYQKRKEYRLKWQKEYDKRKSMLK